MSKQRRQNKYGTARPTSYSYVEVTIEKSAHVSFSQMVYSNLLNNYERVSQNRGHKKQPIYISEMQEGTFCKIRPYELQLQDMIVKTPNVMKFLEQHKSKQHMGNNRYVNTLIFDRTLSKKDSQSRAHSARKSTIAVSPALLSNSCKVNAIDIKPRPKTPVKSHISEQRGHSQSSYKVHRKIVNLNGGNQRQKSKSMMGLRQRMKQDQMIEPWCLKNYESIML